MIRLALASLLITDLAFPQGGDRVSEIHGTVVQGNIGSSLSKAGDVNADGIPDFIFGGKDALYASVHSGLDLSELYRFTNVGPFRDFGALVSGGDDIDADGFDDLIVAAAGDSLGGGVYVFSGFDGSLLLRIETEIAGGGVVRSIDFAGDVDLDGHADILIGTPNSGLGGVGFSGSVFLISGADGSLMRRFDGTMYLEAMGHSVSGAGDTDADGHPDIVIGSPFGHQNTTGHAKIYSGRDGGLLHRFDGVGIEDRFGLSVSDAGDLDLDGHDDVIIGANSDRVGPGYWFAGSSSVFSGADGHRMYFFATGIENDKFGTSVSAAGDVNQDGYPDVMSSAIGSGQQGFLPGRTFIHSGRDGQLLYTLHGGRPSDLFGTAVADVGDTDQDGFDDILVGAYGTNPEGEPRGVGTVYLHYLEPFLTTDEFLLSRSSGGSADLDLDFPDSEAFLPYRVLASRRGTGPTPLKGLAIPLQRDGLFRFLLHGGQLSMLQGASGFLDQQGNATATLTVPSMAPAALVGTKRWFAATTWDPGFVAVRKVSAAVSIEITP